jgi:hypothetical protein
MYGSSKGADRMTKSYEIHQKWLDERFNHVNTVLDHISRAVEDLHDSHARCSSRCSVEMDEVYHRLREVEQKQAVKNGAEEHEKESKQAENITWQMIIALGTAASAIGVFVGYFMGKT